MTFCDLESVDVLGARVKDDITGFTGIAVAMSYRKHGRDLVKQVAIQCEELIDGKPLDEQWVDINRLNYAPDEVTRPGFNPPPAEVEP